MLFSRLMTATRTIFGCTNKIMAVLKLTLFIVALVAAGWSYLSYIPVPPNVEEPLKYSLFVGFHKAVVLLAPYFGDFDFIRSAHARMQYAFSRHGDSQIRVTTEVFGDVPVRLYQPLETGFPRPGVVFYHGGGFNMFTTYGYDGLCLRLARDLDAVVVSVDYRLAPENTIPTAFEDSKRATLFFFDNSAVWDVDRHNVGAVGDGSGANLALAMALLLRDAGSSPQFAFVGLLSPWVQGLDLHLPSYLQHDLYTYDLSHRHNVADAMTSYFNHPQFVNETLHNSHISMAVYKEYRHHVNRTLLREKHHKQYCPVLNYPETAVSETLEFDLTDPYSMPLMADDFTDLPPTFIMTTESEGFRDEGLILAGRMGMDGHVVHAHSSGGWYGMMLFVGGAIDVQEAGDMTDKLTEFASEYV